MEISAINSNLNVRNNFIQKQNATETNQQSLTSNPQNVLNALSFMGNDRIPEKDLCMMQLRKAKDNEGNIRFSPKEAVDLYKELGRYETKAKKSVVLNKLLNIGKGQENNRYILSFNDIANFFAVTSGAKVSEQAAVIDILENDKMVLQENNFDDVLFIHLENNPKLLKTAGKIRTYIKETYKGLSSDEQKGILSLSLGILSCSDKNGAYYPYLADMYKDIARKMVICSGVTATIDNIIRNTTQEEFTKILPILTEDNQFELADGLLSALKSKRQRALDKFFAKYSNN